MASVEEYDLDIEVEDSTGRPVRTDREPVGEHVSPWARLGRVVRAAPIPVVFVAAVTLFGGVSGLALALAVSLDLVDVLTAPTAALSDAVASAMEGLQTFLWLTIILGVVTALLEIVASIVVFRHRIVGWALMVAVRLWLVLLPIVLHTLAGAMLPNREATAWAESAGWAGWTMLGVNLGVVAVLFSPPVLRWLGFLGPATYYAWPDRSVAWRNP